MDQFERQKLMRQALNGRMTLMFGGIFLMFSAVTSTIMYGINFLMTAWQAGKGVEEYVNLLEEAKISSTLLIVTGILFLIVGICEVVTGFLAMKNSNRVDKSASTMKMILALLIVEIIMEIYLFFAGLMNLGLLVTAVLLPLFMLWGVTRLRKVAKAEPERIYAVDPVKNKGKQQAAAPAPKKSIRERAAMQARTDSEEILKAEEETLEKDPGEGADLPDETTLNEDARPKETTEEN